MGYFAFSTISTRRQRFVADSGRVSVMSTEVADAGGVPLVREP
jgi:hypothetical protein